MILIKENIRDLVLLILFLPKKDIDNLIQVLEVYPNTFLKILKEENKK